MKTTFGKYIIEQVGKKIFKKGFTKTSFYVIIYIYKREVRNMKRTFNFGKIDYYGRGRKINLVEVEVRLSDDGVFTASATIWNSKHTDCVCGGQCLDEVAKYVKSDKFKKIYRLWKQYHLNDMHAGTEKQEEVLKAAGLNSFANDYSKCCDYLE